MANVAIVQGSSQGIGLAITQFLLRHSNLQVVATTSKDPNRTREKILEGFKRAEGYDNISSRLTNLTLDVRNEESISKAAETVSRNFGNSLRFLVNVSGVLLAEKSITKINKEDMQKTFQINTFGHMLVYKHFFPLLPNRAKQQKEKDDPANGWIGSDMSILASFSARVGSISDNSLGGWYSYRASKTAINQVIVTLQREIDLKKSLAPTICIAYHPGTVLGTGLSSQFVSPEQPAKAGKHPPDQAVEKFFEVLKKLKPSDGGKFLDYQSERLPW